MLPFGHLSAGYLISRLSSKKLLKKELILVLAASIILDLDLLLPPLFGFPHGAHHYFPIHTPLFVICFLLIFNLIFGHRFSSISLKLSALTLFFHLVLDDLSHWLSLLNIGPYVPPQILWLYPFDPRSVEALRYAQEIFINQQTSNLDIINSYLFHTPALFYLEILLTLITLVVYFHQKITK